MNLGHFENGSNQYYQNTSFSNNFHHNLFSPKPIVNQYLPHLKGHNTFIDSSL